MQLAAAVLGRQLAELVIIILTAPIIEEKPAAAAAAQVSFAG